MHFKPFVYKSNFVVLLLQQNIRKSAKIQIIYSANLTFQSIEDVNGRTIINPSSLRTNRHYVVYYNFVTKTLLTELFPYVTLIFLNACIYREIRRSVKIQQAMRCTQSQKEEIKSANVVVRFSVIPQIQDAPSIFELSQVIEIRLRLLI